MNKKEATHLLLVQMAIKDALAKEISDKGIEQVFNDYRAKASQSLENARELALKGENEQACASLASMVGELSVSVIIVGAHAKLLEDKERLKEFKANIKKLSDDFYGSVDTFLNGEKLSIETPKLALSESTFILMKAAQKQAINLGWSKAQFENSMHVNMVRIVWDVYKNERGAKDYVEAQNMYQVELSKLMEILGKQGDKTYKELKSGKKMKSHEIQSELFSAVG